MGRFYHPALPRMGYGARPRTTAVFGPQAVPYPRQTGNGGQRFWRRAVEVPEVSVVPPDDDVWLEDETLRQEIELLAEVMVAAAAATRPLAQTQIDEVLARHGANLARDERLPSSSRGNGGRGGR